ncbi:MAG TPA: cache domain-containing protein [Deltaproteobacteria bacterium]|nr:cache domain-containing protein [Deltaproteobacteria bacterium]HPR53840.1 cache domain-containing protein [Deltaproteobacteria bacterium]HXK45960.1 cache domain-containing protein [Deltaproteobacteria bacterium]
MRRIRVTKRHTIELKETKWDFIIWLGSFIVLGFVVVFALYSYRGVEEEMAAQFNREQGLLAQQTAMGIEQYMHDITNILSLTAHIRSVADGDPEAIKTAVENVYTSLQNKVVFVFWEDKNGIMRIHHPRQLLPGLEGKDFSFRTYFRVAKELNVPFVSDIILVGGEQYYDIPGRFETFVISFPLKGEDGTFNGVIGCAIDLSNITVHYVAPIRPSKSGYVWMLDETGMILYHPNPKWIGLNLKDIIIGLKKQGIKISGVDTIRQAMELKNDGMYEFVFPNYPDTKPVRKLLAFSSVHFLNRRWVTITTSPYSEVIDLMSGTFSNTLILGSVSIGFVLIATITMLRINRARAAASERNKWADRVLVAHKRMETIFNGVPHYLVMIDAAFTITDINQRLCDAYGLRREDIIDKHCSLDLAEGERLCHTKLVEQCFKSGEIVTERDTRVDIGGKPFFFDISAIPLFGSEGEVDYVVQYAVDITEKKALTEKLIQAEKLAAVGQMSAHVAHEIRNPLTSVLLHSELLEDEIKDMERNEEALELLKIIENEIDRLSQVTDEYLSYARLPHPKKQLVNPQVEVSSVLSMLMPELKRRNIESAVLCPEKLPDIMIDRGQFKQLLINLIKNAEDAMPSGGSLEVSLMGIKDNLLLLVKDTGYGIPPEITRRIFDPYFTTKDNGTGLGLALVQYIANAHDGWVDVESQKGTGSTFIISFPFHKDSVSEEESS